MKNDPEFAVLPENKLLENQKRRPSRAKVPENVVEYNKDEEAEKEERYDDDSNKISDDNGGSDESCDDEDTDKNISGSDLEDDYGNAF